MFDITNSRIDPAAPHRTNEAGHFHLKPSRKGRAAQGARRLDMSCSHQYSPTSSANGDRAGLAVQRGSSAWIGVRREGGATRVVMVNGLTVDSN
ncbi:hypothetical protein [Streptomyces sp. NPDC001165]|uniref:hypothetical protein n=1 Tax=Streptomyces sp. NPDC001165 TaxID=3364546 RepID=UPI0036B4790A